MHLDLVFVTKLFILPKTRFFSLLSRWETFLAICLSQDHFQWLVKRYFAMKNAVKVPQNAMFEIHVSVAKIIIVRIC